MRGPVLRAAVVALLLAAVVAAPAVMAAMHLGSSMTMAMTATRTHTSQHNQPAVDQQANVCSQNPLLAVAHTPVLPGALAACLDATTSIAAPQPASTPAGQLPARAPPSLLALGISRT
ncbi:hypothetical protein [Amnibacterium endophyticum]|uniref:Secreted protein n=1 Tax=Amnibacterium endophyticum TaxID=2109337 RepID=A0ABW4LK48_9MICO